MTGARNILVVNAGSSSVKLAVFGPGLAALISGQVSEVGGAARLSVAGTEDPCLAPDHDRAIALVLAAFAAAGHGAATLAAAGHRVVHGGRHLTATRRITPEVEAAIAACVPLAPLHNPANLAGIRALARLAPDLPQVACFDTAFHATNPEVALRYALPPEVEAAGIRRYGFHGIAFASLTQRLPELTGQPLPARLLALHLGNGASLCAIRDGRSVATTMGYSPLDGLTMGTRAGGIDGNAVLRLASERGVAATTELLNRQSGLLALGGASDMRALRAADTPEARFAIAHFCYWASRHAGSMIAAMGGVDALAFTGGIGENDAATRAAIIQELEWIGIDLDPEANHTGRNRLHRQGSKIMAYIVPAAEERHIAAETLACLGMQA